LKKTTNDELNQWHFQYPSTAVSWNFSGDPVYCEQFVGEAKNMLYRLKNRMNIAVPKLKTLQDIRHYDGGTVITVRSIFGQDFIEINAGRGFPSCLIKLLDLPEAIPPMKWYAPGQETFTKGEGGWEIKNPNGMLEVEGVDYIKTYFSWVTRDCPSCSPLEFTVAKGDDANILTGSSPNRPFWYKSENDDGGLIYEYEGGMVPHYMGYTTGLGIVIPDNPLNHTIYSLSGCQAQILKNGSKWTFSDAGGSYFLWKAYTEWSNVGPTSVTFSRTGLGYMLMKAFIKNGGTNLCETDGMIIKVDCCLKVNDLRQVILWWESLSGFQVGGPTCGGQPFMFYGSMKICEVPTEVAGIYAILCIGAGANAKPLYVIPEIKGSCLPFEWSVSNEYFNIVPLKPLGELAILSYKQCPNIYNFEEASVLCNQEVIVTVTDRCGTEDHVRFISLCEDAANKGSTPPFIGYTSLVMGCGAKQTLTAGGGCGPYTWSAGGAGSLSVTQGPETEYTAPNTNVNCANNDITVTDCCGNSSTVTLFVSCNTTGGLCYREMSTTSGACQPYWGGYFCGGAGGITWTAWGTDWNCAGQVTAVYGPETGGGYPANCAYGVGEDPGNFLCEGCSDWCTHAIHTQAWLLGSVSRCMFEGYRAPWGVLADQRSAADKTAGCCPMNPFTGLPM
jgi:hypothetical protein